MVLSLLVLLILVIMPALLYLVGWGVTRYIGKAPARIGFAAARMQPSDTPRSEAPAWVER